MSMDRMPSEIVENTQRAAFKALPTEAKLEVIYDAQLALMAYVRDLEKKAEQMGSPEGMAKMMESFTGNMFGGMKF